MEHENVKKELSFYSNKLRDTMFSHTGDGRFVKHI